MNKTNKHVLVVDDNAANVLVATITLDNFGYAYDVAKDGMAAVELFSTKKYDLILMDMHMPDMSGYEAIQQIRSYELKNDRRRTPIIVITADPNFHESSTHISQATDGAIIKPYKPEELLKYMQEQCPVA